jgi:hypothetical protein
VSEASVKAMTSTHDEELLTMQARDAESVEGGDRYSGRQALRSEAPRACVHPEPLLQHPGAGQVAADEVE